MRTLQGPRPQVRVFAEKFKVNPNVVIATIDGTINEVPGLKFEALPALYLYPKGQKQNPMIMQANPTIKTITSILHKYVQNQRVDLEAKADL